MSLLYHVGAKVKNGLNFASKRVHGYCGQWGQDRWVIEDMFRGMRGGYFVDIGAYDGWIASNTFALEKRFGWTGICVEPNDELFPTLTRNRACTLVNACIADEEKEVEFLEQAGAFGGMLDTYPPDHRSILLKYMPSSSILTGAGEYRTVRKPAMSLATLLRSHEAPPVIDYLSIDTEGAEYLILQNFPFHEYTFLTLTLEHNSLLSAKNALRALLEKNGYQLARDGRHDDFYYHPSIIRRLASVENSA